MAWLLLAFVVVVLVLGAARVLLRKDWASLPRSGGEVADILRQFLDGEPTGFLADDFIHIPIRNPQLEQIRQRFEDLAERHMEWEPQLPFPESGREELQRLITEAEALDRPVGGAA